MIYVLHYSSKLIRKFDDETLINNFPRKVMQYSYLLLVPINHQDEQIS